MIGMGLSPHSHADPDAAEPSRRRRTPSKYAQSIRELAKVLAPPTPDEQPHGKKRQGLLLLRRGHPAAWPRPRRLLASAFLPAPSPPSASEALGDHQEIAQAEATNPEDTEQGGI